MTKTPSIASAAEAESALRKKLDIMAIELEVYREIGGLALKGSPRSSLFERLMDFALKAMDTNTGALYTVDGDGGLNKEVWRGTAGKSSGAPRSAAKEAASTGRARVASAPSRPGKEVNLLAVPLMRKKRPIGVIEVVSRPGRPFTAGDILALSSLANHFTIILERAELGRERNERLRQFSTLNAVGGLLISTLDQKVVRHRAMEAVTTLMKAETGSLLLVDRDRGELYFEVALGEKGKRLKEVRLSLGEGIAGWVAKHGRPLIIHDVTKDSRFQGSIDKRSKFRTRNMVCVPIAVKGKVIGVLQAINRLKGPFTRDDLKLFQLFSNQVAIALDNARLYAEVKDTFYATSGALAEAIEKRDPYTGGHTKRVLSYCLAIARHLDLPEETVEVLRLSAVLHDIGKIGIGDRILRKDAPLTREEAESMRLHPQYGAEILKHVPQLKDVVPGMLYHHERPDGLGYPSGLKKDRIPIVARIIAVADTYDAMTTTRPYRRGLSASTALRELKKYSGRQFDSGVVNAFLKAFRRGEIDGNTRMTRPLRDSVQI